jgi:hypothetical protein
MALGDPPNSLLGIGSVPDAWVHTMQKEFETVGAAINARAQLDAMQAQQGLAIYNPALAQQAQQAQQDAVLYGNSLYGNSQPQLPASVPITPPNRPAIGAAALSARAREMFLKRMGGIRAELQIAADDFVHCHIYGETVYLFYCFAGRDGCVKEGIDLFPSDQLITQFRMVLAT